MHRSTALAACLFLTLLLTAFAQSTPCEDGDASASQGQNVTIQAGNSGLIVGTPNDPRMFGTTLRARQ